MERKKESEIQGERLLTITDELLYVEDQMSGDVIPIPWDALVGGVVHFWGRDGQAILVKASRDGNGGLFRVRTPIGPGFQFHYLLTHLVMEKGWIRDFWIEGDSACLFAGILFSSPEYRNSEEVWDLVRKYDLSARQQYFPIRQWAEARPLGLIKDDFIRALASWALNEEERDGI